MRGLSRARKVPRSIYEGARDMARDNPGPDPLHEYPPRPCRGLHLAYDGGEGNLRFLPGATGFQSRRGRPCRLKMAS